MVTSMSGRELERDGLKAGNRPPVEMQEVTDPSSGAVYEVPKGIDPGWDYNPGKTAWGDRLSNDVMREWKAMGPDAYERLTPETWKDYGLSPKIPFDKASAAADYSIPNTREGMEAYLKKMMGADEKVFSFTNAHYPSYRHDVLVNAERLAEHLPADRAPFLPFLRETIEDPYEAWLSFEKHKGTGKVEMRQRFIKVVETDKGKGVLVVTQARKGIVEAWTIVPSSDLNYMNRQRWGRLLWKRD